MAEGGRFAAVAALRRNRAFMKLAAMMGLSFLVIFVVGILRPIRDAIALSGLEPGKFYQVYFVSAVVVLFVPVYNRIANRVPWKRLIPAVAIFFAISMVVFRVLYQPRNAAFGMVFYGWYDIMVAALVTQFFMATQVFYNARDAKRAYPLVIAAGSVGAALGGAINAFFSERVGTANLLLVAGAAITMFAVGLALVWAREDPDGERPEEVDEEPSLSVSEFRRIFSNRQVQLIALTVLLTVLVKQFVDYEYKTLSREVYTDVDELSGFLGLVDALTQWLPIVVLLSLRPILRRWGALVGVLIFPIAMIFATGGLAIAMTLPVAVIARTGERMFRYSAERTGRELLYVPVPGEIKLKAKAYVDVAVEKGLGKSASGVIILVLVMLTGGMDVLDRLVVVAFIGLAFAVALLVTFLKVRGQYVRSLARSFEGRFASLEGTYISVVGPRTRAFLRDALSGSDRLKTAFALDLVEDADPEDIEAVAPQVNDLLEHEDEDVRRRALDVLAHAPAAMDRERVRARLGDTSSRARRSAVRTLAAAEEDPTDLLTDLLDADDPQIRSATLSCLATDVRPELAESIATPFFEARRDAARADDERARLELAEAAGLLPDASGISELLKRLVGDEDPEVAAAAVRSAGRLGSPELVDRVIEALGDTRTRPAARDALADVGEAAIPHLVGALNARETDLRVRLNIPGALGDIPCQETVDALIESYINPETEQALDDRALAALARLRSGFASLDFPRARIESVVDREIDAAARYVEAAAAAERLSTGPSGRLLARALREAREKRRESLFRWLGLVYPQDDMYRSHLAIDSAAGRTRANALEWLESTVGHTLFIRLAPALRVAPEVEMDAGRAEAVLRELWDDEDVWLARCAIWALREAKGAELRSELEAFEPGDPGLREAVRNALAGLDGTGEKDEEEDGEMDLIEKVFLLQNVDLLSGARSQQLALLASIARVVEVDEGAVLLRRGEPTDALYIVIRGEVELEGVGGQSITVEEGSPFGTWALIDRDPSLVEARAVRPSRLLRIHRTGFQDLMVDHPELGVDLLRGLARRIRTLAPA